MKQPRERFALTLEALPDNAPAIIRLRWLLKAALRSYGLHCTAAVQLHDAPKANDVKPVPMED